MEKEHIDLRSQNDNSREWRDKRAELTEALLRKALSFINESDKKFTNKHVCEMMAVLASDEDRTFKAVISPSAISKNNRWKSIIQTYEMQSAALKAKQKKSKLSEGDMAFELHKCKTLLAQKSDQVKELDAIIKKEGIDTKQSYSVVEIGASFDYKHLLRDAYSAMIDDGFVIRHNDALVLEMDKTQTLATKELLLDLGLI